VAALCVLVDGLLQLTELLEGFGANLVEQSSAVKVGRERIDLLEGLRRLAVE
jgi:hypothetical protein